MIPEGVNIDEFGTPVDTSHPIFAISYPGTISLSPAVGHTKNHITLLRALKHIEETRGLQIPLVMTGGSFSAAPRILSYLADQTMDYVRYLGTVTFPDLIALYQKAALLVMPSLHESNSLPILEAAAARTPVLAARIPNEELAQTFQLTLFEPLSHEELAAFILQFWEDPSKAEAQVPHNSNEIIKYSWDNSARRYQQFFEKMVGS